MTWWEYMSHVAKKDIPVKVFQRFLESYRKEVSLCYYSTGRSSAGGRWYYSNTQLYCDMNLSYSKFLEDVLYSSFPRLEKEMESSDETSESSSEIN